MSNENNNESPSSFKFKSMPKDGIQSYRNSNSSPPFQNDSRKKLKYRNKDSGKTVRNFQNLGRMKFPEKRIRKATTKTLTKMPNINGFASGFVKIQKK